jgi:hypothetical protein
VKRVTILPRTTQPGWELWWLNPPHPPLWLASRISRDDAVALAVVEGWEVV